MRVLSAFKATSLIAVLLVAVAAISGSGSVADDRQFREPHRNCEWRGTAPFCKGRCETGEIHPQAARNSEEAAYPGFGADCVKGLKSYCCRVSCPEGWILGLGGLCERPSPAKTKLEKGPIADSSPAEELKKGPIEAPGPVEGTKVEEGTVGAPASDAPYATKRNSGPFTQD
jgi:hypothetical protein